jgi:hypothetical protein
MRKKKQEYLQVDVSKHMRKYAAYITRTAVKKKRGYWMRNPMWIQG